MLALTYRRACIEGMRKFVRHNSAIGLSRLVNGDCGQTAGENENRSIYWHSDTDVVRCWVGHLKPSSWCPLVPTTWRLGSLLAQCNAFALPGHVFYAELHITATAGGPCQALNFSFKHQVEIRFSKPQCTIKHHKPESLDLAWRPKNNEADAVFRCYTDRMAENQMLVIKFTTWYLIIALG